MPFFTPGDDPGSSFPELLRRIGLTPDAPLAAASGVAGTLFDVPHATTCVALTYDGGVVLAGDHQHRDRHPVEVLPQRGLVAGTARSQAVGQPGNGVAASVGETVRVRRQPGEHRSRQPFVEERFDADLLEVVGAPPIDTTSVCAFGIVVDAGRGADQHEPFDCRVPGQCGDQSEPATHRVADVGACSADGDQAGPGARDLGTVVGTETVPR